MVIGINSIGLQIQGSYDLFQKERNIVPKCGWEKERKKRMRYQPPKHAIKNISNY